jgi:cytoskeletal protein CcmA (bactofilin family)
MKHLMRRWVVGLFVGLMTLAMAGGAWAAEVRGGEGEGDIFRLPADQVVNDDLYVGAGEVFIDGTVEGDLIAVGGYVEVNGNVTGDVMIAAGGIVVNGNVQDDARLAGGGVTIAGRIGDDLFVASGGPFWPGGPAIPIQINQRQIPQGLQFAASGQVAGDGYIVGGQGRINGAIDGNLFTGMGSVRFAGQVGGNAELYGETVEVSEGAKVAGSLRFRSAQSTTVPSGVATTVQKASEGMQERATPAPVNPLLRLLGWLWRTLLLAVGFGLLAWLLAQWASGWLTAHANAIDVRPVEGILYGLVATALIVPLIGALVLVAAIFWGWLGAAAVLLLLLGGVGVLWLLSPVVTGYWVGRQLHGRGYLASPLWAFVTGALLIVLAARLLSVVPCVGALAAGVIYLLSFAITLGGWFKARQTVAAPVAGA